MGFTFTVTQVMVIRELLVVFTGNELSTAIILANWLLLEAAGSFWLGRKVEDWKLKEGGYAFLQFLVAILLPLTIYGIRWLRDFMGLSPGETASLLEILLWTIPILAPIGIVDGTMFALACCLHAHWKQKGTTSIGHVYLLEALGAGIGGVLYTFLFIPFLSSFQAALLLGGTNLASGLLLVGPAEEGQKKKWIFSGLLGGFLAVELMLLSLSGAERMERSSLGRMWRGIEVLQSRWSPFGNVAVGRREEQITFFSNGIPIGNVPVPNIALVEEMVHYPLLASPSPKKALIIGGGFGGVINEVLKHGVEEIHYTEIDPLIVELVQQYLTPLTRAEMEDPKVKVHTVDGRFFVKTSSELFDVIILNLPGPTTLELNRFYTQEFFREVLGLLKKEGVFSFSTPGSETYLAPEVRDLNLSLLKSLRRVFPSAWVIPGDVNFILAFPSMPSDPPTPELFIHRLKARNIRLQFVTDFQIRRKLDRRRLDWLEDSLAQGGEVLWNRDANPSGLYYGIAYWNAQFHPSWQTYWSRMKDLRLWHLALALLILALGLLIWRGARGRRGSKTALLWVVITTGFSGTAASILLIFSFQTLYGYAYQWIGLLVAAFMVGLALGSWIMTGRLEKIRKLTRNLAGLEVLIILYSLGVMIFFQWAYSTRLGLSSLSILKWPFFIFAGLSGILVGLEFPLSCRIFSWKKVEVGPTAGILYASDLFGAWAGSLMVGVVLIPILGILQTCAVLIILKLASLFLIFTLPLDGD